MTRCTWAEVDDLYRFYHDEEWGKPVCDDLILFEFLVLESFQAGLSWHTILKKRENFRAAFEGFNYKKIAVYKNDKIERLLTDSGIIRHRQKIAAAINNAQRFQEVRREHGSFSNYLWNFVGGKPIIRYPKTVRDVPAKTELSDALAKDLKNRGFKFLGSTTVYAYLQAVGVVNDHLMDCNFRSADNSI